MDQKHIQDYINILDEEISQEIKERLSSRERGKLVYIKWRCGYYRGYREIRRAIIERYGLTEEDFKDMRREDNKEYRKHHRRKRKKYFQEYYQKNKEELDKYRREYDKLPNVKEKNRFKKKKMRELYREYQKNRIWM